MNKRFFIFLTILFLFSPLLQAKHLHLEKEYQEKWCNAKGGIMEYKLDDNTRVDCLLPDMAVEFDFASKWAECIGQALYYGKKTDRAPVCVLIMENKEKDIKYLNRLQHTTENLKFKIYTMQPEEITTAE